MLKNTLVTLGIGAALVLGAVGALKTIKVVVPAQPAPIVNVTTPEVKVTVPAATVSKETPNSIVGAVPTLDGVQFPFVNINGLRQMYYSQQSQASSSVVCSVLNPFGTTTALNSFKFRGTNRMGAQIVDISTSTTVIGSSSPAFIKGAALPVGRFDIIWGGAGATTTNTNVIGMSQSNLGATDVFIRNNEYITVRIATGTPGTFANGYIQGGVCGGVFEL